MVCVIQDAFDSSRLSGTTARALGEGSEFQLDMDYKEVTWILQDEIVRQKHVDEIRTSDVSV